MPVGTLSVLKKSASKPNPALIVTYEGVQFVIQQFKAFAGFGKPGGSTQDEQPGALCHFFWLKNATGDKEVNLLISCPPWIVILCVQELCCTACWHIPGQGGCSD